ncbi:hypothetical protein TNCV_2015891 [Trichonephila clavipes]|nr:hypothetical protein TNCV_2015891 [Trichonephila clavipes]
MTDRRKGLKTISSEVKSPLTSSRVNSDRPQSIRAPKAFKKFHPKIMSWLQSDTTDDEAPESTRVFTGKPSTV